MIYESIYFFQSDLEELKGNYKNISEIQMTVVKKMNELKLCLKHSEIAVKQVIFFKFIFSYHLSHAEINPFSATDT